MKSHTVWCNISGEAAGEIWNWSLSWPKGLICAEVATRRRSPLYSSGNVLMLTMPIALSMAHAPRRGMATSLRQPQTEPQRSPVLGRARRPTKERTWALQQVACFALKLISGRERAKRAGLTQSCCWAASEAAVHTGKNYIRLTAPVNHNASRFATIMLWNTWQS